MFLESSDSPAEFLSSLCTRKHGVPCTSLPANKPRFRSSPALNIFNCLSTMPPAATIVDCDSTDKILDVGGIEVEQVKGADAKSLVTRISLLSWEETFGDDGERSRYSYFLPMANRGECSAESFDSADEIDENSNEAKLIKCIARKAILANEDLPFPDGTEAQYLDELDGHIEEKEQEKEPEIPSFAHLESDSDDIRSIKPIAHVDEIVEHLIEVGCCHCTPPTLPARPLKSALRSPKWSSPNDQVVSQPRSHSTNQNTVQFKDVDVREFRMTLGDHPSACSGPPVRLDWDSSPESRIMELEEYEKGRQPRRNRRQLKLSLQRRHNILVIERGFTFEEVKAAWHDALEIRRLRKETLERGLALMKWDEVWESTCRKFNRIVDY
eukprot:scaffold1378_cov137-Cylindrotheca_fusiformis.AAC.13